jgi:hypothetical protein
MHILEFFSDEGFLEGFPWELCTDSKWIESAFWIAVNEFTCRYLHRPAFGIPICLMCLFKSEHGCPDGNM